MFLDPHRILECSVNHREYQDLNGQFLSPFHAVLHNSQTHAGKGVAVFVPPIHGGLKCAILNGPLFSVLRAFSFTFEKA